LSAGAATPEHVKDDREIEPALAGGDVGDAAGVNLAGSRWFDVFEEIGALADAPSFSGLTHLNLG